MDANKAKEIDLRTVIELTQERDYGRYKAGYCPFHENDGKDHTPSFLVYKGRYRCYSSNCGAGGDIFNWYSHKMFGDPVTPLKSGRFGEVLAAIYRDFSIIVTDQGHKGLGTSVSSKPPKKGAEFAALFALAESYHSALLESPKRVNYFLSRGFSYGTILRQMWGWDGRRYAITVWKSTPQKSRLLSIRFRRSEEYNDLRYSGVKGMNDKMLYNREALVAVKELGINFVLVFYGELDAQLAWQDGLPAVSPTNGALSFIPEWFEGFEGEKIYVPDIGEERAAIEDAGKHGTTGWVVHLPRSGQLKDYTDFRTQGLKITDLIRYVVVPQVSVLNVEEVEKTRRKCLNLQQSLYI